ncbi:lipopolysaccharide-induced tumor necrosis factor-alpha factor homolog [Poecilia formosa]|uniref:lipopolysaccharide-induced tumor necrosis factor-alpha factor homolog n=1 Tax=Poecilia formosa TaxID=48698 RepID=UPI0007B99753|nr:PREDICTED: lipopolysaccharide-induced tumor necrosis factor-alpha factor homolog [Poecilia formosa]
MGKLATLKPKVIRHRLNMSNPEVAVATVGPLGENPAQIMCTKCHQTVVSEVKYSSGLLTYLFCGGLFLCGFVFGCCLIPFCVDRLKDAKHTCPICKTVLGVYRRL